MISDTLWDIALTCLIGAFIGLVVGQFVEPRDKIMFCIFVGMMICMTLLIIFYSIQAYKEWKREQKRNKNMYRSGYNR